MTLPNLRLNSWGLATAAFLFAATATFALDAGRWKTVQSADVAKPGPVKLTLPPETLDAARADFADVRILDPNGRETPYLIDVATATRVFGVRTPKSFRSTLRDDATEITIATGTHEKLAWVTLSTPAPLFLKAAPVETSDDGEQWRLVDEGVPVFRQFGAEQLQLLLRDTPAAWVRVTLSDDRSRAIPVTGARLGVTEQGHAAPTAPLLAAHILRREEFAGETVFTVDLGAAHLPLASVTVDARDPLFTRKVTLLHREVVNEAAVERTLAIGTIYRVALDGAEPRSELTVQATATAPSRELLVRVENGDSPPLTVNAITVRQRPVMLYFPASTAGTYRLLAGNPGAGTPRYDLAGFGAELRNGSAAETKLSHTEANPDYHGPETLPTAVLSGAPFDPEEWSHRRRVDVAIAGVQQLELDPDALAGTANDCADVRLVRDGKQVPYVLERPPLSRPLVLHPTPVAGRNAQTSRWEARLPATGLPLTRLVLKSTAAVFDRPVRILAPATIERRGTFDQLLAAADWHRVSGDSDTLSLGLNSHVASDTLVVEMDNGDNPAIALTSVEVTYPVVRLLFSAEPGPLTLVYGNPHAFAPRYDLALLADQLVAAEKHIATLGPAEAPVRASWLGERGQHAGLIFWGALALVVVALLIVVAKLLPKPPA